MSELPTLVVVVTIALIAPFAVRRSQLPVVVAEIVLGLAGGLVAYT